MADERAQRRLAAVLAADVVGYSRLMGADEVGTLDRLNAPEPHLLLAVAQAYLGDLAQARAEIETAEAGYPGYTDPSAWLRTYKHAADKEHFLEGIRKARSGG